MNYAGTVGSSRSRAREEYLSGKASGLLTFGLKGACWPGPRAGARFSDASLQLFTRSVNIGGCALSGDTSASTHDWHHYRLKQLEQAGVSEDTVRLLIGVEDINDILTDLDEALAAILLPFRSRLG